VQLNVLRLSALCKRHQALPRAVSYHLSSAQFALLSSHVYLTRVYAALDSWTELLIKLAACLAFSFARCSNRKTFQTDLAFQKHTSAKPTHSIPTREQQHSLLALYLKKKARLPPCPWTTLLLITAVTHQHHDIPAFFSPQLHHPNTTKMARIQIPLDALTSRLNLGDRFSSMRSTSLTQRFSNLRPLSEFFDVKRFSKPANFGETQSRVNYNLGYFSSNYFVVFLMLAIYSLLTNLWLLFDIIFVFGGTWLVSKLEGRDLEFGNQRFTTSQLYTGIYIIAIPVAFIASTFSTFLWLIGASGVTILGHAALLDKPIDEAFSGEAV